MRFIWRSRRRSCIAFSGRRRRTIGRASCGASAWISARPAQMRCSCCCGQRRRRGRISASPTARSGQMGRPAMCSWMATRVRKRTAGGSMRSSVWMSRISSTGRRKNSRHATAARCSRRCAICRRFRCCTIWRRMACWYRILFPMSSAVSSAVRRRMCGSSIMVTASRWCIRRTGRASWRCTGSMM